MTLYRARTRDGRAAIVDADRLTRARTLIEQTEPGTLGMFTDPDPLPIGELLDTARGALAAIGRSLGDGVSLTCSEYADIRALAAIIAPETLADLDERHAIDDDEPEDCSYIARALIVADRALALPPDRT